MVARSHNDLAEAKKAIMEQATVIFYIKRNISVFLLLASASTLAQSPKEFLETALLSADVESYMKKVDSVNIDCDELRLGGAFEGFRRGEITIPVKSVEVKLSASSVVFNCIAGGGCIRGPYGGTNSLHLGDLSSEGLPESIANAFLLHQPQCGGAIKRDF